MFASNIYYIDTYPENGTVFAKNFMPNDEYMQWLTTEYNSVKNGDINPVFQQINQAVFAKKHLETKVVAIGPHAKAVGEFINTIGHGHIADVVGE